MSVSSDNDFDASFDLDTLVRAKEIEKDPGRMMRAREHALQQQERFSEMAKNLPGTKKGGFNGSVRGSKMEPK